MSFSTHSALTRAKKKNTGVETAGREHGSCNHAVGEKNLLCNKTSLQDHCADLLLDTSGLQSDLLVVKARARGQLPQRSGQSSTGKLTCQNLLQYTQERNNIQQTHAKPTPKPNKRQATDQPKRIVKHKVHLECSVRPFEEAPGLQC